MLLGPQKDRDAKEGAYASMTLRILYCRSRSCLCRRCRWRRVDTGATPDSIRPEILTNMTKVDERYRWANGVKDMSQVTRPMLRVFLGGPSQSGKSRRVETEV